MMKLPEGSKAHPWVQKFQWMTNPLEFMEASTKRYGDIFTLRIGSGSTPQVFISNPQAIQQIFSTDPKVLDSGEAAGIKPFLIGQQSMLMLEGKPHQLRRKLLTPPFHGERMQAYAQQIREITALVTDKWLVDEAFSVLPSMQEISLQVILKAVFGLNTGQRYDTLKTLLLELLNPKQPFFSILMFVFPALQRDFGARSPGGYFLRLKQQINEIIYTEIQERREKADASRTDILSLMMATRDELGQPMTDIELRDELMTLLVAGHETTATALSWALYWIHSLPEVREKLLRELDNLGENPEPNAISQLPYLNAVCSETLRLYPVVMLGLKRLVKSPMELMGHQLTPGTLVIPCIYLTHHREDLYPNSKQFQPERFLKRQFSPSEFLPFGGGNRRCIGQAFAMFEMKLVLAKILSNLQMTVVEGEPVQPVRKGNFLAPSKGVPMVVTGRRMQNQQMFEKSVSSI